MGNRKAKTGFTVTAMMLLFCICAFFTSATAAPTADEASVIPGLSQKEALRLGEKIYREGILPSGEPLMATVGSDTPVEGTMFTCQSCHLRSGLGSYEGGVQTTPTNGAKLYQPQFNVRRLTDVEKTKIQTYLIPLFQPPPRRPAYTDQTLAEALLAGVDPAGRELHRVMPRYILDDRNMAILINYLKSLSSTPSPGVTDKTIRFATVITDDVSQEERDAMLIPLERYIRGRNSRGQSFETKIKFGTFAEQMDFAYRRPTLVRWELKGAPETWRSQLEEYYRKEPVFALLGGISGGDWRPVHEFSEEHGIPCIFPITDYPVISETDWYTLYLSRGLQQEGEAAARYIGSKVNLAPDKKIIQIYRDNREGRAFSSGFQNAWQSREQQPSLNITLKTGEKIDREFLEKLLNKEKPAVLLLWVGPEAAQALEIIATGKNRPDAVFVSSTQLQQNFGKVPEQARDFTYITYPFALSQPAAPWFLSNIPGQAKENGKRSVDKRRITASMTSITFLLSDALMMIRNDYFRDRFMEVIDNLQDRSYPYTNFERLSFGPGQRYASKGCFIVQLSRGASPQLIRKSDWVMH